jgi:predicted RNA-binding Zn-ribbon protein involved in translation (DUF1610 family)
MFQEIEHMHVVSFIGCLTSSPHDATWVTSLPRNILLRRKTFVRFACPDCSKCIGACATRELLHSRLHLVGFGVRYVYVLARVTNFRERSPQRNGPAGVRTSGGSMDRSTVSRGIDDRARFDDKRLCPTGGSTRMRSTGQRYDNPVLEEIIGEAQLVRVSS